MTTTHFTAWLVNDASCLDQSNCDLTVLEDQLIGADPEDDGSWSTDTSKDTALYAVTDVDASDCDIEDAINQAEQMLAAAGWTIAGTSWEAVDNAYIVTVERTA